MASAAMVSSAILAAKSAWTKQEAFVPKCKDDLLFDAGSFSDGDASTRAPSTCAGSTTSYGSTKKKTSKTSRRGLDAKRRAATVEDTHKVEMKNRDKGASSVKLPKLPPGFPPRIQAITGDKEWGDLLLQSFFHPNGGAPSDEDMDTCEHQEYVKDCKKILSSLVPPVAVAPKGDKPQRPTFRTQRFQTLTITPKSEDDEAEEGHFLEWY